MIRWHNEELRKALCGDDEFLPNRQTRDGRRRAIERLKSHLKFVGVSTSDKEIERLVDCYLASYPEALPR